MSIIVECKWRAGKSRDATDPNAVGTRPTRAIAGHRAHR